MKNGATANVPLRDSGKKLLLTREEAARMLGVSTRSVTDLIAAGALRTVGIHSGKRIVRSSVYEYCGERP